MGTFTADGADMKFHCRPCNYFEIDTRLDSFNDLLEHIGLYHADLYPNLAIAPLVIRRDIFKWVPRVEASIRPGATDPSWLRKGA